jgi:hypothetical protein
MNLNQQSVILSIDLRGAHKEHGSYSHFHRVDQDGNDINGVRLEKSPKFCKSYKTITLGSEFVKGALEEPPENMKTMRPQIWKRFPERKRISIHVNSYVKATHPENRGYTMEIFE